MSNDLNLCQFIGRLGSDPETAYLPSGKAVTKLSIACSELWKDKSSGQKQEKTEWVRCTAFDKLAEICGEYLRKGSQVYVSGKMRTRKFQAQDGSDRYSTEIVIDQMQMLGNKSDGAQPDKAPQRDGIVPVSTRQAKPEQESANYSGDPGFDDFDDLPY